MLHAYDRATIARLLTHDVTPHLRRLLQQLVDRLGADLIDHTEILVIENGDTEDAIVRAVGFSPLVEPINGTRYGSPGFSPFWDWLVDRGGWFEMVITFGSTFACVLLIEKDAGSVLADLCSEYT